MGLSPRKRKNRITKKRKANKYRHFNKESGKWEQKETRIETIIRILLTGNDINFIQERIVPFLGSSKRYDFYCWKHDPDGNVLWEFFIEAHGTYFHAKDYIKGNISKKKLNLMQRKNIKNDQIKINLAKRLNVPLLVFWEDTIKNRPLHVRNVILDKIERISSSSEKSFFYEDH